LPLIFEIDVTEILWAVCLMMNSAALAWNLTPPLPKKKKGGSMDYPAHYFEEFSILPNKIWEWIYSLRFASN
jgi:hypothetical protein